MRFGTFGRRPWLLLAAILTGLTLATGPEVLSRLADLGAGRNYAGLALFLGVWVLSFWSLLRLARDGSRTARLAYGVLFTLSSTVVLAYRTAMGSPLEALEFERLVDAAPYASEALSQFSWQIAGSALLALPLGGLLIGLGLRGDAGGIGARRLVAAAAPLVPVAVVAGICWLRGGQGTVGLPSPLRPLGYALAIAADDVIHPRDNPLGITRQSSPERALDNVVYVVDESIVSDVFDPLSSVHIAPQLVESASLQYDFSPAASGSNCSEDSNLILRVGPRGDHLRSDVNTYPSIWEYAKHAGYTTIYIDEQNSTELVANGITPKQRRYIDQVLKASEVLVARRDAAAGVIVARLLREPGRHFIYINKVGAHFPWDSKYPADHTAYRPTLGIAGNPLLAHAAGQSRELFSSLAAAAGTVAYRNSYRNAVEWNLNSFFAALRDTSWSERSVILYTSDHGQNVFREGGRTNTHCSSIDGAARSEGRVPLMVYTAAPGFIGILADAARRNAGRVGHFNLFATLIRFMGYPESGGPDVRDPPLWALDPSPRGMRTAVGLQMRFGQPTPWLIACSSGKQLDLRGACHDVAVVTGSGSKTAGSLAAGL